MTNNGHITPTSGKSWREHREHGVLIELPSSTPDEPHIAALRSVDMGMVLELGRLPDSLTSLVAKAIVTGEQNLNLRDQENSAELLLELANAICRVSFVNPRIVENPQADDEISLLDVSLEDRMFVLRLFQKPARILESFRVQPQSDVEPVRSGESDESESEPDHEPESVGE